MSEPSTAELALAEALWDAFMHQFHDSLIASNAAPLAVEIALAAGWVPPEALEQVGWINAVGSVVPMSSVWVGFEDDPAWVPVYRRAAGWTPPEGEKT